MSTAPPPLAAIVVPTHDHAATLDLAVRSALEQSVAEIEVLVVGDGVGDDTRSVAQALAAEDPRVRFLDLPKGPGHGEVHRGTAIEATRAEIVCYLCDDDLLLPEHVESMAELLRDADLAHSQNGYLDAAGTWHPHPADLSSPAFHKWLLRPDRNAVSLTGTAHTRAAYMRLPHGWRTTPPDRWPDHYMWQQFISQPGFRGASAGRITALQFPSHVDGRESWEPARRRAELESWRAALATPEGRTRFERAAGVALDARAATETLSRDELRKALYESELARAQSAEQARILGDRVASIESTRTWRLRNQLRKLRLLRALARATARRPRQPERPAP